jgi:hypothetical protein
MYSEHRTDRQVSASNDNGRLWATGKAVRRASGGIITIAGRTCRPVALDYVADGVFMISPRLAA